MKTRWIQLIAGLTMSVLCISVCTTTANATVIWEDDFDDENLDGWTIFGWESMDSPVKIEGNFSAASGMLTALDDDLNVARHDSNVTVGTWSFDMFVPDDDYGFIRVEFMSNGASLGAHGNMSWIAVSAWFYGTAPLFYLLYGLGSSKTLLKTINRPLQGWHHIEASRNDDGRFLVYFNGTLEANVTSTLVTSSTYLQVLCNNVTGAAIDNLVVEVETPTPSLPPDIITYVIVGGVAAVVIVVAIVFLRRR
ncbi:MAG: hypothetical protein ACXACD_17465 [Candidatus Thorarchaeota archaeon]|jgi:hypothetical protein